MRKEIATLFLLSAILAIPIASAASIVQMSMGESLFSILVILGFIGILLYLGGVIKFSGTGSWKNKIPTSFIAFAIFLIIVFIVPMFVKYPSYIKVNPTWQTQPLPESAAKVFVMLGLPEDWMYVPAIIYLFVIPFAAIYTLVWAFLNDLKIFSPQATPQLKNVNKVLAFLIAFSTIPLGYFTKLVHVLFAFLGGYSVAMFAAMFIVGVFGKGYGYAVKQYDEIVKRRKTIRAQLAGKLSSLLNVGMDQLKNELVALINSPEAVAALSPGEIDRLKTILTMTNEKQMKDELKRMIKSL